MDLESFVCQVHHTFNLLTTDELAGLPTNNLESKRHLADGK